MTEDLALVCTYSIGEYFSVANDHELRIYVCFGVYMSIDYRLRNYVVYIIYDMRNIVKAYLLLNSHVKSHGLKRASTGY